MATNVSAKTEILKLMIFRSECGMSMMVKFCRPRAQSRPKPSRKRPKKPAEALLDLPRHLIFPMLVLTDR